MLINSIFSKKSILQAIVVIAGCAIAVAYISQYFFNVIPCELCFYHRYPLMAIIVIGSILIKYNTLFFRFLLILLTLVGLIISTYHLGVEQHWWKGPERCTTPIFNLDGLTTTQKLAKLRAQMSKTNLLVPCDQVSWRIFGLSAVLWSVLMYLFLCILSWIVYEQKKTRKYFAR